MRSRNGTPGEGRALQAARRQPGGRSPRRSRSQSRGPGTAPLAGCGSTAQAGRSADSAHCGLEHQAHSRPHSTNRVGARSACHARLRRLAERQGRAPAVSAALLDAAFEPIAGRGRDADRPLRRLSRLHGRRRLRAFRGRLGGRRLRRLGRLHSGYRRTRRRAAVRRRWPDRLRLHRRQQRERIDVPVSLRRPPNTQIHVRNRQLGLAARTDGPDRLALGDRVASPHRVRTEMEERDGIPVRRLDRDRLAPARDRSRERHRAAGGRGDDRTARSADVDSAVLPGRVGIGPHGEADEHRAGDRPAPAKGRRSTGHRGDDEQHNEQTLQHARSTSVVGYANTI
jgi:hypothetical protein